MTAPPAVVCTLCGAPLARDQEWCLECGAGRTIIRRAPAPWLALLTVVLVAAVALGGFVLALARLTAATTPPTAARTGTAAPQRPAQATLPPGPGGFLGWPVGLDGWTVVLALHSDRSAAVADARRVAARTPPQLGVLDTDQHPGMHPGHAWEVFSGRYPNQAAAQTAASALARDGFASAHPVEVQAPGAP